MTTLERVLFALLWEAIPCEDDEDAVPPAVYRYVEWVYSHPPEMWGPLTGT